MQGASEFVIGGVLTNFNTTGLLPNIRRPTLLTSGRFDTMRPPVLRTMLAGIPNAIWHMFNHSGHMSMIDDAGEMNDVLASFLEGRNISHIIVHETQLLEPPTTGPMLGIAVIAVVAVCAITALFCLVAKNLGKEKLTVILERDATPSFSYSALPDASDSRV